VGKVRMIYDGVQSTDRRENSRKNFKGPIAISYSRNATSIIFGWVQNISASGIRLKTAIRCSSFQKGDEVTFIINEEYFLFEGEGVIIWISPVKDAVGIKFSQLAEEERRSLEEFLRLLSWTNFQP
jgi:hypothetical protein